MKIVTVRLTALELAALDQLGTFMRSKSRSHTLITLLHDGFKVRKMKPAVLRQLDEQRQHHPCRRPRGPRYPKEEMSNG